MTNKNNINGANDILGGLVTNGLIAVGSLFRGKAPAHNQYTRRIEKTGCRPLGPTMTFLEW